MTTIICYGHSHKEHEIPLLMMKSSDGYYHKDSCCFMFDTLKLQITAYDHFKSVKHDGIWMSHERTTEYLNRIKILSDGSLLYETLHDRLKLNVRQGLIREIFSHDDIIRSVYEYDDMKHLIKIKVYQEKKLIRNVTFSWSNDFLVEVKDYILGNPENSRVRNYLAIQCDSVQKNHSPELMTFFSGFDNIRNEILFMEMGMYGILPIGNSYTIWKRDNKDNEEIKKEYKVWSCYDQVFGQISESISESSYHIKEYKYTWYRTNMQLLRKTLGLEKLGNSGSADPFLLLR